MNNEETLVLIESKWNKRRRLIKGKNKLKKLYEDTGENLRLFRK